MYRRSGIALSDLVCVSYSVGKGSESEIRSDNTGSWKRGPGRMKPTKKMGPAKEEVSSRYGGMMATI